MNTISKIDSEYNLSNADLENALTVYVDKNNNYVFNLNETVNVVKPRNELETLIIEHPIHWSILSYKLYNTTRFAWLLLKINGISVKNMFSRIPAKTTVFYLSNSDVITIVNMLQQ